MKIWTIYTKTATPNRTHYANANRFIRSYAAHGEAAAAAKVAELRAAGIDVTAIYNPIGNKVEM